MNDQDEQALQKNVPENEDVEPRASSEESQPQEPDQVQEGDDQSQEDTSASEQSESEENIKSSTEDKRPTRRDRRIDKLINKLKGKDAPANADSRSFDEMFGMNPSEPLIRPEEFETGIDPQELERRQRARDVALEDRITRSVEAKAEFKSAVNSHIADSERTAELLKDDPDLDDRVGTRYYEANHSIDPYTGKEVFIPRVLMSDIYKEEKDFLEKRITKAQADVNFRLKDQADSALRPSVSGESSKDYQDQELFEDARRSGGNEDKWAEVLKRRLSKQH